MTAPPVLIGVNGKARSGKDTTFAVIRDLFPGRVERVAFADALREEARTTIDPQTGKPLWDGVIPYTVEGRAALQSIGHLRRQSNPRYWIDKVFEHIRQRAATPLGPDIFVITDVRYRNEADAVREAGGFVLRIARFNSDGSAYDNGMTAEQKRHPSEIELDGYHGFYAVVLNSETLHDLEFEVTRIVGGIVHRTDTVRQY